MEEEGREGEETGPTNEVVGVGGLVRGGREGRFTGGSDKSS